MENKTDFDELVERAIQTWIELTERPDAMLAYHYKKKQILDERAAVREAELRIQEAWEEGRKEGREAARQEGELKAKEEIAINLLNNGHEIERILRITELTEERIFEIQREMLK